MQQRNWKVWHKERKDWCSHVVMLESGRVGEIQDDCSVWCFKDADVDVVLQTGLRDKNDADIYEGDILLSTENNEVYRIDHMLPAHRHSHATNIGYYTGGRVLRAQPQRFLKVQGYRWGIDSVPRKKVLWFKGLNARLGYVSAHVMIASAMDANPIKAMERIRELESALGDLRVQLETITSGLAQDSTNTSLVIRRVNVMKRIMLAQSEIDTLRSSSRQS